MVSISAGKYWTAAVTATGDVYMWDGKKSKDNPPLVTRLHGIKKATSVSVGETHLLIVGSLYHPIYPLNVAKNPQKLKLNGRNDLEEFDEDFMFNDESNNMPSTIDKDDSGVRLAPSLKSLCENVAAQCLVEPRNALQLLEISDSLGADDLKKHCEVFSLRQLFVTEEFLSFKKKRKILVVLVVFLGIINDNQYSLIILMLFLKHYGLCLGFRSLNYLQPNYSLCSI